MRKLEARLGVVLFQRHARGVTLTAEGRQLADAAGSALADMEGVLRSLRGDRDDDHRVRITTLHSLDLHLADAAPAATSPRCIRASGSPSIPRSR